METNLAFLKHKNSLTPSLENIIAKNEELYKPSITANKNVSEFENNDIIIDTNNIVLNSVQENTSALSDSETLDDDVNMSMTNTNNDIDETEPESELEINNE